MTLFRHLNGLEYSYNIFSRSLIAIARHDNDGAAIFVGSDGRHGHGRFIVLVLLVLLVEPDGRRARGERHFSCRFSLLHSEQLQVVFPRVERHCSLTCDFRVSLVICNQIIERSIEYRLQELPNRCTNNLCLYAYSGELWLRVPRSGNAAREERDQHVRPQPVQSL